MKRFFLSLGIGIVIQLLVVLFWIVSKQWNLPAVWDYVLAPGMLPTTFYMDSDPPRHVLVICFIINVGIYTFLSYLALGLFLRIRRRRAVARSA